MMLTTHGHQVFNHIFFTMRITTHSPGINVVYIHSSAAAELAWNKTRLIKTEVVKVNLGMMLQLIAGLAHHKAGGHNWHISHCKCSVIKGSKVISS